MFQGGPFCHHKQVVLQKGLSTNSSFEVEHRQTLAETPLAFAADLAFMGFKCCTRCEQVVFFGHFRLIELANLTKAWKMDHELSMKFHVSKGSNEGQG